MKTVIEMAREAGWLEEVGDELPCTGSMNLERFAELVRADEREACAKYADEQWVEDSYISSGDAIRARGGNT